MKNQLSEKMQAYLWEQAEIKAKIGFDSLFCFCRATKHGFSGNRDKTECEIELMGITKKFKFEKNNLD